MIKTLKIHNKYCSIHRDSWTHTRKTRSKVPACQITPKWLERGISMESLAGFQTSMLNSQKIMTGCILRTESSLMVPRTITTNLTMPPLLIKNSSDKMLPKDQSLVSQIKAQKHISKPTLTCIEKVRPSIPVSEEANMQHLSF